MAERRRAIAREEGFSLVELLVAAVVLAVGLLALVSGLDHSRELVNRSEKIEVATHQAEEAIERALAMRFDRVALPAFPASSTDDSDPRFYVSGTTYQWDQGTEGGFTEELSVDAVDGQVANSYDWADSDSRLEGEVHQFVTVTPDRCTGTGCPVEVQAAKRVTVAVTVDGPDALPRPISISTLMIDPAETGYEGTP
jgi:prepilin-type N-terminal cleavage/methylation domain-containing protein